MFTLIKHLRWMLPALFTLCGIHAHAQSKLSAEIWQQIMTQLPQPVGATPIWPRSCLADYKELREKRKFNYASPSVEEKYRLNSRDFTLALATWGAKYFGMPLDAKSDLCRDFPFVIARMQEAAGESPTGVFGESDIDRLQKAINFGAKIEASKVYAFGFELGAVLALPACPPGNLKDFPRVCAVPADVDTAHPTRALEFERLTISAPHFPAQPGVPSDGLVMIMYPKQVRPEFLSDRRAGLFGVVANGRLEGVLGWSWPEFPMINQFTAQYGKPTVARVGTGLEAKLVYSFKTTSGMAKISCDPTGRYCDVAQVLTDVAPPLLERAMRNLRIPSAESNSSTSRTTEDPSLRSFQERVRQQNDAMADRMRRDSARARQQEAEETERVLRQNEQIRRQQEAYEEEERRRRNRTN